MLLIVALYAAAFVVFGFLVDTPAEIFRGLVDILTSRDALLTDYIGIGGMGAAFVNAGLLTLCACFVYYKSGAKIGGAAVACLFLVLGFALFGKNLLNVWFIVAGVFLYSRFRNEPFATNINTAFFGVALAPIFSEILFSTSIPLTLSLPLSVVDQPGHRVHARARRRAAVQSAHGIHPVQHGIHRRPGGDPGCRAL